MGLRKNLLQRDTWKKLQRTFATCDDVDALAASPVLSKHELNPKPTHSSSSSSSSNNNNNNNNNKNAAPQKLQKPQMPSARACARSNTKENQTTQQRADLRRRWNSVQQSTQASSTNASPHPVTGHAKQASSFPHWTRQRSKSTCRHNSSQRQLPHTRPQPILDTAMAAPACRLVVHRCACLLAPPPSPLLSLSELALHTFFFSACRKSPFPSPSFLLSFFLIATAQMPAFVYHLWEAGDLTVCIPLLP